MLQLLWQALHAASGYLSHASFDMKTAVRDQVDALSVNDYFNYLARLMKTNLPLLLMHLRSKR